MDGLPGRASLHPVRLASFQDPRPVLRNPGFEATTVGKGWLYWAFWTGIGGLQCIWPFLPKLRKAVAVCICHVLQLAPVAAAKRQQALGSSSEHRAARGSVSIRIPLSSCTVDFGRGFAFEALDGPPELSDEILRLMRVFYRYERVLADIQTYVDEWMLTEVAEALKAVELTAE